MTAGTKDPKFNSMTGLKAICCLMIMVLHSFKPEGIPTVTNFILEYFPHFGNYLFFMISGFLMGIFYRDRIQQRQVTFRDYMVKKLIKFYPLFALTNIIAMLLDIVENGTSHFSVSRLVLVLLLCNGGTLEEYEIYNYPTWFMCVLVVCFILFFFISYISNGNNTKYLAGAFIMIAIGYWARGFGVRAPFLYAASGIGYINFFMGVIVAEVYRKLGENKKAAIAAFSTMLLLLVLMIFDDRGFGDFWGEWVNALSFCIGPLLIFISMTTPFVNKILSSPPFMFIGKLSISIYFWHAVMSYLYSFSIRTPITQAYGYSVYYAVYLVTTFIVCLLSHIFIEKKFTSWLAARV